MTANSIEESEALTLDFNTLAKVAEVPGVLPCAVQNADTGDVILVAYVNEPAFARSIETRSAVFWSASRNDLWERGKTSGKTFDLCSKNVKRSCEKWGALHPFPQSAETVRAGLAAGRQPAANIPGSMPRRQLFGGESAHYVERLFENIQPLGQFLIARHERRQQADDVIVEARLDEN
jgi:phosphoribosyl-AMP cyclohydrolase